MNDQTNQGKWYILRVVPGRERSILAELKKRIIQQQLEHDVFDLLMPLEQSSDSNDKAAKNPKRLLPGYILVKINLSGGILNIINKMKPGILGFLGGKTPTNITQAEVDNLYNKIDEHNKKKQEDHLTYRIGDKVKIIAGAFQDFSATVENVDDIKKTVDVVVSILKREIKVKAIEFTQVIHIKSAKVD